MIKEFTFICICYNQAEMITEHLDSIKEIIINYGSGIKNHLIISDDCSKDSTVDKVNNWIKNNQILFSETLVLTSENNQGTVKNIYKAIDHCKTKEFKILAGDDKYFKSNIYSLYSYISDEIVITPVIPFGNFDDRYKEMIVSFKRSYRLLIDYNKRNNIGELLLCRNFIFAPGAFVSGDCWRDKETRELLSKFKYVEDIPMWIQLIYYKKKKVRFDSNPYIYYRISGNATLNGTKEIDIREQDFEIMRQVFPDRAMTFVRKIRVYYFKYLIKKAKMTIYEGYDDFFKGHNVVENMYIDSIK